MNGKNEYNYKIDLLNETIKTYEKELSDEKMKANRKNNIVKYTTLVMSGIYILFLLSRLNFVDSVSLFKVLLSFIPCVISCTAGCLLINKIGKNSVCKQDEIKYVLNGIESEKIELEKSMTKAHTINADRKVSYMDLENDFFDYVTEFVDKIYGFEQEAAELNLHKKVRKLTKNNY